MPIRVNETNKPFFTFSNHNLIQHFRGKTCKEPAGHIKFKNILRTHFLDGMNASESSGRTLSVCHLRDSLTGQIIETYDNNNSKIWSTEQRILFIIYES